jgi:alginate O-acetyltransferase complex protein AlgI
MSEEIAGAAKRTTQPIQNSGCSNLVGAMGFNTLTFLIFFAIVLGLHRLPLPWKAKKLNLVVASYLFYAAWNPPFVLLLYLSSVVDFYLARLLDRTERLAWRKAILAASLSLSLGVLVFFKYAGFLLVSFTKLMALMGIHYRAMAPDVILPLGISFYTFETVSYLVDVYRRKIRAWPSFIDYTLFLAFFPHLVAGPIVRPADFLPQCAREHRATRAEIHWGLVLMLIGLFEKVTLADAIMAPVADNVYRQALLAGSRDAWLGTIAFSGQVFFDFAGYSMCGIGAALCLGFALKDNFRFPYAAVGFSDFWKRWHISLSTWLRDYLYIPLGGNRNGEARTYANLMLTMLLGGLWHGAAWRFVAWGGLHGGYLTGERLLKKFWGNAHWTELWHVRFGLAMLTWLLVCVTWVFFRATDFASALHVLRMMVWRHPMHRIVTQGDAVCVLGITAGLLLAQWFLRETTLEHAAGRLPRWVLAFCLSFMLLALVLAPGEDRAFIYFQF